MRNVCEVLRAKARGEVPELPDLPEPVQAAQAAPAPLVAATNEAADAADAADAAVTADLPAADAAVPWPADMPADISAVWLAVSLFFGSCSCAKSIEDIFWAKCPWHCYCRIMEELASRPLPQSRG